MSKTKEIIGAGPADFYVADLDVEKEEDLLECLWLQQWASKLKEYYEDVKVEFILTDDGMVPCICIHGMPCDIDEVRQLLIMLPYESRLAKEAVEYDCDDIQRSIEWIKEKEKLEEMEAAPQ